MDKGTKVIDAGAVSVAMRYRDEIMHDQGLCLQVYGDVGGKDTEILRFDCFDQSPHYHYGPENHNIRLDMDKTTVGNPLGWTINNLRTKLPTMVRRAGYDDLAAAIEARPISNATFDEVESSGRTLSREGRRTVAHKFERMLDTDVFVAGNIRFGLEYRLLPQVNDEGMAIHVLADDADQQIELLAFDCFNNGPHYHYGPRNKDIRVYWDVTTSGNTLQWTLDQFKGGKLKSMIERAGYPGIAAELDENLIQSKMPEIEARAWALVAENNAAKNGGSDQRKTKAQLIEELDSLRQQVSAL